MIRVGIASTLSLSHVDSISPHKGRAFECNFNIKVYKFFKVGDVTFLKKDPGSDIQTNKKKSRLLSTVHTKEEVESGEETTLSDICPQTDICPWEDE